MESNPREPLLAGIAKSPPTDECSVSGADISESRTSPRRTPPPPPPPPPPRSLLGLGVAKNRSTDECSGSGADISESGTSPRLSPPPPSPPLRSLLGSGSPKSRLDSVGVERVIGIFGFSLFGSLSLFPYTIDRIKDFTTLNKSIVMFSFGLIWVLASAGVLSELQGKSNFEQTFCRFTGRLGIVGLAFLVIFHVWWTLPGDNTYCIAGFYALLTLAFLLHFFSWGMSLLVGEDRIEDKASSDAQD